jgi:hypothetical protein
LRSWEPKAGAEEAVALWVAGKQIKHGPLSEALRQPNDEAPPGLAGAAHAQPPVAATQSDV